MDSDNSVLRNLLVSAKKDFQINGYVGMDYNMALICILSKRLNLKMDFMEGGKLSYEQKIEYWASKRNFCHLHFDSEDDLINHAMINTRYESKSSN